MIQNGKKYHSYDKIVNVSNVKRLQFYAPVLNVFCL
ncbi:unnamed protein product [Trichobilharzia regenti]|nr:unnamed protein product [Trichobilharzia regenti]